ncbi:MAG: response regulator transcription factor [Anaerolineae bacterium]
MAQVLVVDDEANIVELAQLYLSREGYEVVTAADGEEALEVWKREKPDLIVLDLMMPKMDGWEVCRRLRAESDLPIIMLTARGDEVDRVAGLEMGADDYVVKPFNPRELVARVRAVLRRVQSRGKTPDRLEVGDLVVDGQRRQARIGERVLDLTKQEHDLLWVMAEHAGMVLTREQLLDLAWGYDFFGGTRTVDVHVSQLRRHLEPGRVEIQTVRGVGYRLAEV